MTEEPFFVESNYRVFSESGRKLLLSEPNSFTIDRFDSPRSSRLMISAR